MFCLAPTVSIVLFNGSITAGIFFLVDQCSLRYLICPQDNCFTLKLSSKLGFNLT